MKTKSLNIILALALILAGSTGYAQTWKQINANPPPYDSSYLEYYGSIEMSADGRILCTLSVETPPIISTNYGIRWAAPIADEGSASRNLGGLAVSADGSRIFVALAGGGIPPEEIYFLHILTSTNQGTNWQGTGFPILSSPSTNNSIACSADGMKVIASLGQSAILYSTNGGANCYTSSVSPANWNSFACSATGSRMVAAADGGSLYFSEDFGANWTPANLPAQAWTSVCISPDGKSIGATSDLHSYISSDSGVTWLTNDFAGLSIACSADGTVWLITSTQVEISTDGGHNWQANLSSGQWSGGAISADGNLMAVRNASPWTFGVWVRRLNPSPQLNIQSQDPNIMLSWLVPSTNFVLQQTADLSNPTWTPVSSTPTLNITDLQDQISLPTTGSNTFFRLIAQ